MAERIERKKVYEVLNAALNETDKLNGLFSEDYIRGCRNTLGMIINDIQKIPTADTSPVKHGFWDDSLDGITPVCSVCGMTHHEYIRCPDYCPHCHAKMDGKDIGK